MITNEGRCQTQEVQTLVMGSAGDKNNLYVIRLRGFCDLRVVRLFVLQGVVQEFPGIQRSAICLGQHMATMTLSTPGLVPATGRRIKSALAERAEVISELDDIDELV